jgi:hypothetical protein
MTKLRSVCWPLRCSPPAVLCSNRCHWKKANLEDCKALASALQDRQRLSLSSVHIDSFSASDSEVVPLIRALKSLSRLTSFTLCPAAGAIFGGARATAASALAELLRGNSTLTALKVGWTEQVTAETAFGLLVEAICATPQSALTKLNVSNCQLMPFSEAATISLIGHCPSLSTLSTRLSGNSTAVRLRCSRPVSWRAVC